MLDQLVTNLYYLSTTTASLEIYDVTIQIPNLVDGIVAVNGSLIDAADAFATIANPVNTCDGPLLENIASQLVDAIALVLTELGDKVLMLEEAQILSILQRILSVIQGDVVIFEASLFQLTPDCDVFTAVLDDVNKINSLLSSVCSSLTVSYTEPPSPQTVNYCYVPTTCSTDRTSG